MIKASILLCLLWLVAVQPQLTRSDFTTKARQDQFPDRFNFRGDGQVQFPDEKAAYDPARPTVRVLGVIGLYAKGKTWLLNRLFEPQVKLWSGVDHNAETLGFSMLYVNDWLLVDTAGLQRPVKVSTPGSEKKNCSDIGANLGLKKSEIQRLKDKCEIDEREKRMQKNFIDELHTEQYVFELVSQISDAIIFVVNDYTWYEQKEFFRLLSESKTKQKELFRGPDKDKARITIQFPNEKAAYDPARPMGKVLGMIGLYNKAKTWLLNRLFEPQVKLWSDARFKRQVQGSEVRLSKRLEEKTKPLMEKWWTLKKWRMPTESKDIFKDDSTFSFEDPYGITHATANEPVVIHDATVANSTTSIDRTDVKKIPDGKLERKVDEGTSYAATFVEGFESEELHWDKMVNGVSVNKITWTKDACNLDNCVRFNRLPLLGRVMLDVRSLLMKEGGMSLFATRVQILITLVCLVVLGMALSVRLQNALDRKTEPDKSWWSKLPSLRKLLGVIDFLSVFA